MRGFVLACNAVSVYIGLYIEPRVSETDNNSEQMQTQKSFISRMKTLIFFLFYCFVHGFESKSMYL
jgi:hypothetical protein